MTDLFSAAFGVALDVPAVATGHVAKQMAWEDTPNGRRPADRPERDEYGQELNVVDVLLPLGRDGQLVVAGVTVPGPAGAELTVAPLAPIEFVGLRVNVRGARSGKGVSLSFRAEAIADAGGSRGRRSVETTAIAEAV